MPEVGDLNKRVDILLPRGDEMARGHVVAWSHNANGNVMGRAQTNSILDKRIYQVEFTGGKPSISWPSQCMPIVMQMEMIIYSSMCSLIIIMTTMHFPSQISRPAFRADQ